MAVMGLAMALPSTVLAVAWVVLELMKADMLSPAAGMAIILAVIVNIFILIFRQLRKPKAEDNDK